MSLIGGLLAITGVLAATYGALILWNLAGTRQDAQQQAWLESDEVRSSKLNTMQNMRHLLQPERQSISFSRSKGRGYAMLAIGVLLLVFAFTW
jgi:hypothetical protein